MPMPKARTPSSTTAPIAMNRPRSLRFVAPGMSAGYVLGSAVAAPGMSARNAACEDN